MKQIIKTTMVVLMLLAFPAKGISAQESNDKKWVQLSNIMSYKCMKYNVPLYDVRVKMKYKAKKFNNSGIIFGKGDNRVFLHSYDWKYNFSDNVDGGKKFKVSQSNLDAENMRHPDFSQLGGTPFYLISYGEKAVLSEVQVFVDAADYYFMTKQYDMAIEYYLPKSENGDKHAMYMLALLSLEKGTLSDQKRAFDLFSRLSQQGDLRANRYLYYFYSEGKIVPKDDIKAEQLLIFSGGSKDEAGLVNKIINELKSSYKGNDERSLRDDLRKIILSENTYFVNKVLKRIMTPTDAEEREIVYWADSYDYVIYGMKTDEKDSFIKSIESLLKDDCDWLWVYIPVSHLWNLKLFDTGNIFFKGRALVIFDKWCDIALNTTDIALFNRLCAELWTGRCVTSAEFEFDGSRMSLKVDGDIYRNSEIISSDMEVQKKAIAVLKRGADMGNEKWIRLYEETVLLN